MQDLSNNKHSKRFYILFLAHKLLICSVFVVSKKGFHQIPMFAIINAFSSWYLLKIKPFVKQRENFLVSSNFSMITFAAVGLTKFSDLNELQAPKEGEHNAEGFMLILLFVTHMGIITLVFIIGDILMFIRDRLKKKKLSRFYKENDENSEFHDLNRKDEEIKDEEEIRFDKNLVLPKSKVPSCSQALIQKERRISNFSGASLNKSKDSKNGNSDKNTIYMSETAKSKYIKSKNKFKSTDNSSLNEKFANKYTKEENSVKN